MRATAPAASVEREAELLVLVRGREEVVGLGVHAAVDAQQHGLRARRARSTIARAARSRSRLSMTIEPMPTVDGPLELGDALVVAVEAEARGVGARGEGDGELAAGADVDGEALLGHPADDLGATGTPCRRSRRAPARRAARPRPEGVEGARRVRAHLVLVDHVERRAESLAQRGGGDAAMRRTPSSSRAAACGPDARRERVRVVRHGEPRGERSGMRGTADIGWDQSVGARGERIRIGPEG